MFFKISLPDFLESIIFFAFFIIFQPEFSRFLFHFPRVSLNLRHCLWREANRGLTPSKTLFKINILQANFAQQKTAPL